MNQVERHIATISRVKPYIIIETFLGLSASLYLAWRAHEFALHLAPAIAVSFHHTALVILAFYLPILAAIGAGVSQKNGTEVADLRAPRPETIVTNLYSILLFTFVLGAPVVAYYYGNAKEVNNWLVGSAAVLSSLLITVIGYISINEAPSLRLAELMRQGLSSHIPSALKESIDQFRVDYPAPQKTAFLMMRFGKTKAHENIVAGARNALDPIGITVVRADDKQYHDDLLSNVLTCVHGCDFGIAVFERIESEEFNPNVALEVGYMLALGKDVCLLKDMTLKALPADLVGKLYRSFDPQNAIDTIPQELSRWVKDKRLLEGTQRVPVQKSGDFPESVSQE